MLNDFQIVIKAYVGEYLKSFEYRYNRKP